MGSYGPGAIWYYQEEALQHPAPPPPPAVPVRYLPQLGESFGQPGMYATFPPVDPGPPLPIPAAPFGTPVAFDHTGSSSRQESTPVEGTDRRRYRIKRIRTACEECRKRKQRCDGSEYCAPCMEQGTHCVYRDIPPAKKDAMIQKMLGLVEQHSEYLETITEDIDGMTKSLQGIEKRLSKQK